MHRNSSILSSPVFWQIFSESGSIDDTRGMSLLTLNSPHGFLHTFSKTHSYGEYIFDWAWAQAYQQNNLPYYPKLTSMVPFTPATAEHFMAPENQWEKLLTNHDECLKGHSSAHFLFTTEKENGFLEAHQYMIRDSIQYHFVNEGYSDFQNFLSHLKTRKAKNLRHERNFPSLRIERKTGSDLGETLAGEMYDFYLKTSEEKGAILYLTKKFFELLFHRLPDNVLYVRALKDDLAIAGALFYYDHKRIYGRYWGSRAFVPHLHFELCYYQGIDFCLERQLQVFEAGAQGEHKIARGFRPVKTTSAHKIMHPGFRGAIGDFIEKEKEDVRETMNALAELLPFK